MKAGSGHSTNSDAYHAGFEAVAGALTSAAIERADIVFLFASVALHQEQVLRGAQDAAGSARVVGCSTAGEITNQGVYTKSAVALALETPTTPCTIAKGASLSEGAFQAGVELARNIKDGASEDLSMLLMFTDVLSGNGAEVVRGAQSVLGEHFLIAGGGAGDDFQFKQTFQYCDGAVLTGSVVGVGISGAIRTGAGVRHGWMPIGIPMVATKSTGSVLHELDHKPAISIYEEYFGTQASEMHHEPLARMAITYPLGIKIPDLDEYLIRDPMLVGPDGSITCAAEIPQGSEVRLMIGSRDKAIEAAQEAAKRLVHQFVSLNQRPKAVFVMNCIAREKLFGQKAREEIQAVQEIIGADVPLVGFYTYGEIAPMGGVVAGAASRYSRFYNETLVLIGISD
jgi:hypothetical protein